MTKEQFMKMTEAGTVILDGAMGTNLFLAGMPKGVCSEKWVLDHPQTVIDLQRAYVEAGSQIIYAPTFGANRHMLAEHGLADELQVMNRDLVAISKEAAAGRAYVGGDLSPTGLVLQSIGGEASIEDVYEIYKEHVTALVEAGVDLLAIETMMSADEAVIAMDAAAAVCDLPILVTMSVQADGMAYMGGNVFDAIENFEALGASAVGVNCCSGPDQLESLVRKMAQTVSIPIIAKPNAGMPQIDRYGHAVYDMDAETFGKHMRTLKHAGGRLLGGCCGTTPDYIRALKAALNE